MHIRNYEKPDGWQPGHPEVLVAPKPIEKLGLPVVDYDSLHQFLTDDLEIPYDEKTNIRLFGRHDHSGFLGFYVPYTNTIHINAPGAEYRFPFVGGTMRVLAHEARHRSDSTNRKALTAVEVGARWASYKLGYEAANFIPFLSPLALLGGIQARKTYYKFEPAEKRARKEELKQSTLDHQSDIIFPRSERALFSAFQRKFSLDTLLKLGFEDLKFLASDKLEDE